MTNDSTKEEIIYIYLFETFFSLGGGYALAAVIKFMAYLPAFWRPAALKFLHLPDADGFPGRSILFGFDKNDPSFAAHWVLVLLCGLLVFGLRLLDCKLKYPEASLTSEEYLSNLEKTKPKNWRTENMSRDTQFLLAGFMVGIILLIIQRIFFS